MQLEDAVASLALARPGPAALPGADEGADGARARRLNLKCELPLGAVEVISTGESYYYQCNSVVPSSMQYQIVITNSFGDSIISAVARGDQCRGKDLWPATAIPEGSIGPPAVQQPNINTTVIFTSPPACWYVKCIPAQGQGRSTCSLPITINEIPVPVKTKPAFRISSSTVAVVAAAVCLGLFFLTTTILCICCCLKAVGMAQYTCECVDIRCGGIILKYRGCMGYKSTVIADRLSGKSTTVIVPEAILSLGLKAFKRVPRCDLCRRDLPKGITHWACPSPACDYDLCDECFDSTTAKRRAQMHNHALITLVGEHAYAKPSQTTEKDKWGPDLCSGCRRTITKGEEHFTCLDEECKYELCITCRFGTGVLRSPVAHPHELKCVGGFQPGHASQSGAVLSRDKMVVEVVDRNSKKIGESKRGGAEWGGVVHISTAEETFAMMAALDPSIVNPLGGSKRALGDAGSVGGSRGDGSRRGSASVGGSRRGVPGEPDVKA